MDAAADPSSLALPRRRAGILRDGLTVGGMMVIILAMALLPLLSFWVMHAALDTADAAAWLGTDRATAHALSDRTVNEMLFGPGTFAFSGPDGRPFYDAAEIDHLHDARTLLWLLFGTAALAALALTVALVRSADPVPIVRAIGLGGALTTAGTIVIGIIGLVAFEPLFESFHRIFFPAGNWAFDPTTERLVQLYPFAFWQVIAAALGVVAAAIGIGVWAVARFVVGPTSAEPA